MSVVEEIRAIVDEQMDHRPHVGTVATIGVETISVRLSGIGTIIENVPVAGGAVASLSSGDPVWLLYFDEDHSVLALTAKAIVGGQVVGGAASAHNHDGRYYSKGQIDALLLLKQDVGTNKVPQYIDAIGGNIGGWVIEQNWIIKDTGTDATSAGLIPGEYPFYAGATYANRATAPFRVTPAGAITATSGTIGGWTLSSTTLTATGIVLDAGNQKIMVGSAAPRMEIDGANKRIRTSTYAAGLQGFNLDGATGDAEFNNITARGALKVATLQYGQILATNGSVIVPRATGVVRDDFTSTDDWKSGLLAYWLMGEATGAPRVDSVGSLSLSVNGTVSQVAGKQGNAAGTAGASNYLSITDNATMSTGDIDFTFAGWIYLDNKASDHELFSKSNANSAAGIEYVLEYNLSADRIRFRVSNGTTLTSVNWSASPTAATWYFVVCWHDSVNNVIGIQVNDGTSVTTAHSAGVQDSAFPFEVFRAYAGAYSIARVDELSFYKQLLTAGVKTAMYNGGTGITYSTETTFAVNVKDADGLSHAANGGLWAVNDIVQIKEPVTGNLWAKVLSKTDNTTYWTLNLLKQSPGYGVNYTFYKGVSILNYGQSGQGFLYLTADDADGPFYSVRTHAGSPWSAQTEMGRFGNLRNSFGVGANNYYGFGVGDYAGGNYLRYNPTNGFSLVAGNGGVTIGAGGISIGSDGVGLLLFKRSGNTVASLISFNSGGASNNIRLQGWKSAGQDGEACLQAEGGNGNDAYARLSAIGWNDAGTFQIEKYLEMKVDGTAQTGLLTLHGADMKIDSSQSLTVTGGLNVGSATGAGTGEIRASAAVNAAVTSGNNALGVYNTSVAGTRGWVWYPVTNGTNTDLHLFEYSGASGDRLVFTSGGDVLPVGTGVLNLGNASNYWADISYKTLTDRGCLGWFDDGVEMPDGSLVTDTEALLRIQKHPSLETVYGVPRLDYSTMPKAVYKPAIKEGETEGAETTALISIMLGAIRELAGRVSELEGR